MQKSPYAIFARSEGEARATTSFIIYVLNLRSKFAKSVILPYKPLYKVIKWLKKVINRDLRAISKKSRKICDFPQNGTCKGRRAKSVILHSILRKSPDFAKSVILPKITAKKKAATRSGVLGVVNYPRPSRSFLSLKSDKKVAKNCD